MSLLDIDTFLIPAPHLNGELEVATCWQDSDTVALLFHPNPVDGGTMSHKVVSTMFRHCRDKGMSVVRYNSRGVGRSSGIPTANLNEFDDALCVLNWLKNELIAKNLPITTIWLGGFSFGGFMALKVADFLLTNPIFALKKLCLIAPSIIKNDISDLNIDKTKTYVIFSDDDKLVAPSMLKNFANNHHLNYIELNQAGHFFNGRLSDLKNAIIQLDN